MKNRVFMFVAMLTLMSLTVATQAAMAGTSPEPQARPKHERNERHPMIRHAIRALQGAKDDLEDASRDFCGHRAEAAEAVNNALNQLQLALGSDRAAIDPAGSMQSTTILNHAAQKRRAVRGERHPKIRQAINALERARGDLQNAAHDFNGHRVEALEATDRALAQLRAAISCDKR